MKHGHINGDSRTFFQHLMVLMHFLGHFGRAGRFLIASCRSFRSCKFRLPVLLRRHLDYSYDAICGKYRKMFNFLEHLTKYVVLANMATSFI